MKTYLISTRTEGASFTHFNHPFPRGSQSGKAPRQVADSPKVVNTQPASFPTGGLLSLVNVQVKLS